MAQLAESREVGFTGVDVETTGSASSSTSFNGHDHHHHHTVSHDHHHVSATDGTSTLEEPATATTRMATEMDRETRTETGNDASPQSSRYLETPAAGNSLSSPAATPRGEHNAESQLNGDAVHTPTPSSPDKRRHRNDARMATADSIKFDKEVVHLKEQVAEASPKALQKVLRDTWRVFLFENAGMHHLTFVLRALLRNSSSDVLQRVGDDLLFKGGLLDAAINDHKVIAGVLDNMSIEDLIESVSVATIDRLISDRLKSIPARTLVKLLAENNRLGYRLDDVVEDGEAVVPNVPGQSKDIVMANGVDSRPRENNQTRTQNGLQDEQRQSPYATGPSHDGLPTMSHDGLPPMNGLPNINRTPPINGPGPMGGPPALSADPVVAARERERHAEALRLQGLEYLQMQKGPESPSIERMQCPSCHYFFYDVPGFNYHVSKKLCHKEPNGYKFSCLRCYQGFSTKQGQEYHCKKEVCATSDSPPVRDSPSGQLHREAIASGQPPTTEQPSNSLPAPQPTQFTPMPTTPASSTYTHGAYSPAQAVPRPTLHTPNAAFNRKDKSDIRQSPSELPPERLAALNAELAEEDARYARLTAHAESLPEAERNARLTSLKNGTASKKSQIRKKYGVSLRLRDKDKAARIAAHAPTPPPNPQSSGYMSSPIQARNPCVVIPPTSGFSPINASQRPSTPNGGPSAILYNSNQAPQRPLIAHQPPSLRHAQADQPSPSGFGVLTSNPNGHPRYAPHGQMTTSSYAEQQRKRRRVEDEDEGQQGARSSLFTTANDSRHVAPSGPPRMSMMEVSSEDAASRYPPKKRAASGSAQGSASNTVSPVDHGASSIRPKRTTTGALDTAPHRGQPSDPVYISSEGEGETSTAVERPLPASAQNVLPSIESNGVRTNVSRRYSVSNGDDPNNANKEQDTNERAHSTEEEKPTLPNIAD